MKLCCACRPLKKHAVVVDELYFWGSHCLGYVMWGRMLRFPGGTRGNLEEPVHLLFQPPDMFNVVESITQGFLQVQGHHSLPVCALTHFSHPPWQWLCNLQRLDVPEILSKSCAVVWFHTQSYEIWKQVLPWATGLSNPVVLSDTNAWSCGWTLQGTFLSLEDSFLPHCLFFQKPQKLNSSDMWAFRWDSASDVQNWVHTHSF